MSPKTLFVVLGLVGIAWAGSDSEAGTACVWKVSDANGRVLYLGGSIHALQSTDYPLPAAYNVAFDSSTRLVFEDDPNRARESGNVFQKLAQYPKGDSLKSHVDPRTYDYMRRLFGLMGVSEGNFSKFRAWALVLMLQAPDLHGLSGDLGIEGFLEKRAQARSKPISGLESTREHIQVFSGLTDRQAEALLLLMFIPNEPGERDGFAQMIKSWRRGDVESLTRRVRNGFREFPAMGERVLSARNRAWMPKIEAYVRSGQTYFVVVGAGHLGGSDGLLALLRTRGYHLEQM